MSQARAAIPDLNFTIEVGPILQGDRFALQWNAVGTYGGGFPGATAPVGRRSPSPERICSSCRTMTWPSTG
jgi:hypothetical protein